MVSETSGHFKRLLVSMCQVSMGVCMCVSLSMCQVSMGVCMRVSLSTCQVSMGVYMCVSFHVSGGHGCMCVLSV